MLYPDIDGNSVNSAAELRHNFSVKRSLRKAVKTAPGIFSMSGGKLRLTYGSG